MENKTAKRTASARKTAKSGVGSSGKSTRGRKPNSLNFEKFASEGNEFINEVCTALNTENRNKAARITRAVLHTVRDRIPFNEAVHFAQQLPMALKGVFFDQYDPSDTPIRLRTKSDFIEYLREQDKLAANEDFPTEEETKNAIKAVFTVLDNHLSFGQMNQVKALIPADIMRIIDPEFQYPSSQINQENMNRNTRRTSGQGYDRPYRQEDYGYGTGSYGASSYGRGRETGRGSEYGRGGEGWRAEGSYSPYREEEDRNWFERAGDRVREGWNDIKQRFSDDDERGYQSRERYGRDDDRNLFERAGDRINDSWNDMRGRGDEDFDTDYERRRGDIGRGYERNAYGRGTAGWNTQGRGYERDMDSPSSRSRYGRNYPSQGRYGY